MLMLPNTSVAESSTVKERNKIQEEYIKDMIKEIQDSPYQPLCILRLLLWIRNVLIIGTILIIITIIRNMMNKTAPAI